MEKPKVLVSDPISPRGVEALQARNDLDVLVKTGMKEGELIEVLPPFHALVVRSETKANARVLAAARNLRVIGRAGVGIDNVDVEEATRRGVVVMNTPGGNTVSTAEHAFSLLVSLARNIPMAHASVLAGQWDRKRFQGVELDGKTLAILGMGRIGAELARRALAFGMRVLAYDPYVAASRARALQVELIERLEDILPQADFISLHMSLSDETRHILDADRIRLTKPGVRIVNCARGGLLDEGALAEALRSGHVAGAALDVYETEPPPADLALRTAPNVVFTPHLGASTREAQEGVGIEIADAIRAFLLQGIIRNSVNVPSVDPKMLEVVGPYISLGERLGVLLSQLAPKRCDALEIGCRGRVNEADTSPVTRAAVKGFLQPACGSDVNVVNALALAESLGLAVTSSKQTAPGEFTDLIELSARASEGTFSVSGTFFGSIPRVVRVNERHVEARLEGTLLVLENRDRPGMIGRIGTVMGEAGVNIARMSLSRDVIGGRALTILGLDGHPGDELVQRLLADREIFSARIVQMPAS